MTATTPARQTPDLSLRRYIPDGARAVDPQGTQAAIYEWENKTGKPCAVAYYAKQTKPAWHYSFRSAESRAAHIAQYLDDRKATEAYRAERQAEARKPHTLKVGDILHTCWGYDQTNTEFFEVTDVKGATVTLREVAQQRTPTAWLQGDCSPVRGEYIGEPIRRRPSASNSVKIDDVRYAWPNERETYSYSEYA